jgi:hypothetical protein
MIGSLDEEIDGENNMRIWFLVPFSYFIEAVGIIRVFS